MNHYASSGDGLTFTPIDDGYLEPNWEGYPTMMANGLEMDGVYRFYAFAVELGKPAPKDESAGFPPAFIVSFWWDAGAGEWLPDADPRLELDPADGAETRFVMDPAVARFGDCWVMAYVTEAPESA